jgi:hypothetical protein
MASRISVAEKRETSRSLNIRPREASDIKAWLSWLMEKLLFKVSESRRSKIAGDIE